MICSNKIDVTRPEGQIYIGVWDTLNVATATFDVSAWLGRYGPGGRLLIVHQREKDPVPYEVAQVSVADGIATWTFDEIDTAVAGYGSVALAYLVGDEYKARSTPYRTYTAPTLGMTGTEPPDPLEAWYTRVLQASADAQDAAETAQVARDAVEGMTVSSHPLAPGESPTVEKTVEQGVVNLDFGLPANDGGALPSGGTAGQVLTKNSSVDGDAAWKDLPTYAGVYEVTPLARATTTMQTAQKYMDRNIVVREIPYQEVGNLSGGNTATIGG